MLVGVNISDSWLNEASSVLSCKMGNVPFIYMGLFIGGDPMRLSFGTRFCVLSSLYYMVWKIGFFRLVAV